MYGLRFDEQRQTVMTSALGKESVNCTFSFWIKASDADGLVFAHSYYIKTQYVFDGYGGGLTTCPIGSSPVSVPERLQKTLGITLLLAADQDITFYLNGENKGTASNSAGLTYFDGVNPVNQLALTDSKYNILDGYYQMLLCRWTSLNCRVFGKEFPAGWGPLDSSVIDENIGKESPYDTRPNYDQKWSSGSVTADSKSCYKSLDGDLSTGTWADSPAGFVLIFPSPINVSNSITFIGGSNEDNYRAVVDGVEVPFIFQDISTAGYQQVSTLSASGSFTAQVSPIKTVSYTNKVDGRLLEDGPADNSQTWSDYIPANGTETNGFDGDLATEYSRGNNLGRLLHLPTSQLQN